MSAHEFNRISSLFLIAFSLTAALSVIIATTVVLSGQTPQPAKDEGTGAHIFQLAVVGAVFSALVFSSTANWRSPWPTARPLIIAAVLLVIAFSVLYYFEKVLGY